MTRHSNYKLITQNKKKPHVAFSLRSQYISNNALPLEQQSKISHPEKMTVYFE